MKACFRHRKNKKGNCNFFLTILTFFLAIASFDLTIMREEEMRDINSILLNSETFFISQFCFEKSEL